MALNTINDIFSSHERALSVRAARQQLLASNIANADTPNYKARDIDFKSAMQSALKGGNLALSATSEKHIPLSTSAFLGLTPKYRTPTQASLDGNTVETHVEQAQFAENASNYMASMQLLDSDIKAMRLAVRGD